MKILILGGGPEQIIAIKEAKKIGYETIVCDGNINAPGLKLANIGLQIDIRNRIAVLEVAKKYKVNGIFCHAVEIPEVVAYVAKSLNLPGLKLSAAEKTIREKVSNREKLVCPSLSLKMGALYMPDSANLNLRDFIFVGYPLL